MSAAVVTEWLEALGYEDVGEGLITDFRMIGHRPYAAELRDLLDPDGSYQLDAVFLVERTPTVCFIDGARISRPSQIDTLRQRLWNQNLASALLVLYGKELRAYPIPNLPKAEVSDVVQWKQARVDGNWSATEIQSSAVQHRLSEWFNPQSRVDRDLLRQLSNAVGLLSGGRFPLVAHQLQAQLLLAQVLFISYLEHRGIVGEAYRERHNLKTLYALVVARDGASIDDLIAQLKSDFNGDFLEPSDITWADLNSEALGIVENLLSRVNLDTGQRDFWNYDFSQIPVELLSSIYETFLQDERKVDGAYYTPRMLAELAAEQAFAGIDDPSRVRVYDGACGSGILLTTAYRKILAYREAAANRSLDIHERMSLLRGTVFGSDINYIACRVTAFSLYLCLLERLSPPDLARLQDDHDCKLPQLLGENIVGGTEHGDFFSSANPFSHSGQFDIVISNPPWRELRGDEGATAIDWARKNHVRLPHKQIAAAFAARACFAARSGGRIVLILPSSLITAPTNADFLRQYAVRVSIERMINLADFRRLLFAHAEHACTILRAANTPGLRDGRVSGKFEYWTPKVDISFAFNRLTIHEYDELAIPQSALIEGNDVLRRRFWGSQRDASLIQRLGQFSRLADSARQHGWAFAKGYHMRDGNKQVSPKPLQKFRYLPTGALNSPSLVADKRALTRLPTERGVAGYGNLDLYEGPRVLWPDGTSVEIEIRAAYADTPFCFSSAVGGLRLPQGSEELAQLLTCYFRSSLAKYWLILTGYSASAERARVTIGEIKSLPFVHPDRHANPQLAKRLLAQAQIQVARFAEPGPAIFQHAEFEQARDEIDALIYDYFGLTGHERILVQDMVDLVAKSLQPTSYAELHTPLQASVSAKSASSYLQTLEESLNLWSKCSRGKGGIRACRVNRDGDRTPLDIVHVALAASGRSGRRSPPHASSVRELLRAIADRLMQKGTIDFFSMPNSIFVWGNHVYLIKPARKRFWTRSAALRDADEIVELLAQSSEKVAVA